jgi:hypothetical protein
MLRQRIGHFAASLFPQFAMKFSYTPNISPPPLFASRRRSHRRFQSRTLREKIGRASRRAKYHFSRTFSKDYEQKITSDEVWRDFRR